MVRGFSWHTLSSLKSTEHNFNAKAHLSIVADDVNSLIIPVYTSSDGFFQQDKAPSYSDLYMPI